MPVRDQKWLWALSLSPLTCTLPGAQLACQPVFWLMTGAVCCNELFADQEK
jgi:hypothetical protein